MCNVLIKTDFDISTLNLLIGNFKLKKILKFNKITDLIYVMTYTLPYTQVIHNLEYIQIG